MTNVVATWPQSRRERAVLMAADTITIHLPDALHRRLERLAMLTQQPLEGLIVKTLSSNLPPLPDDLPQATGDALLKSPTVRWPIRSERRPGSARPW